MQVRCCGVLFGDFKVERLCELEGKGEKGLLFIQDISKGGKKGTEEKG